MKTLTYSGTPTQKIVEQIISVLEMGGLVIMPTETIYGAMVDATNVQAVAKLHRYKTHHRGKPLSIACASQKMAACYADLNKQAQNIYREFLPGAMTVVSAVAKTPCNQPLAPGVTSEFKTIGVRISSHPLVQAVVESFGRPITATSATRSGQKTPYSIDDVLTTSSTKQTNLIDLLIDAGELPKCPPSIVIDTTLSTPLVMRQTSSQSEVSGTGTDENNTTSFTTSTANETRQLAGKIILKHHDRLETGGLLITLDGQLGAGKTTFTQGIAKYLNIDDIISSPTYTYQKEYDFNKNDWCGTLYHFDAWAIENQTALELLDIPSLIQPGQLLVIEWWDQIKDFANFVPDVMIKIAVGDQENEREIVVAENTQKAPGE